MALWQIYNSNYGTHSERGIIHNVILAFPVIKAMMMMILTGSGVAGG